MIQQEISGKTNEAKYSGFFLYLNQLILIPALTKYSVMKALKVDRCAWVPGDKREEDGRWSWDHVEPFRP